MSHLSLKQNLEAAASLLAALADKDTLAVLRRLCQSEVTIRELAGDIEMDVASAWGRVIKLRALHLLQTRRTGHMIYYSCDNRAVKLLVRAVG